MPNGALANSNVTNMTAKDTRRVDTSVGVAYGTDLAMVRETVLKVLQRDERILAEPEAVVKFINFGDSTLNLSDRCWTKTENLWPVYWDNLEAINNEFVNTAIETPFPQRDIHMKQ
ncbi:MAG: small conductance mechanosensitive channel [Marivirga sp.]|jgi:small conductance mechanosensitive channel